MKIHNLGIVLNIYLVICEGENFNIELIFFNFEFFIYVNVIE